MTGFAPALAEVTCTRRLGDGRRGRAADVPFMNAILSSRRAVMRLTAFAAVAVTILVSSAHASMSQAGANLLQNGDAEAAPGATDNSVVRPPGWVTTGSFTTMQYGVNGAPNSPPGGGNNLFAGGPGERISTATQTVDVSASASAIDGGTVQATLSALLGGWESQGDAAIVEAFFISSSQVALGSFEIGPVTASDRGDKTTMLPRSKTQSVPPQTRSIRVIITAERSNGVYNDGYADNVSLTLTAGRPARTHYRFGFRIADRRIGLSAGSSGSFTTEGQPNSEGDTKVVSVVAKDLAVGWRYRGRNYLVKLRFTGTGTYDPAAHLLGLRLSVRRSNVPNCHVGAAAYIILNKPGDVILNFCGHRIEFFSPSRASSWIKQA